MMDRLTSSHVPRHPLQGLVRASSLESFPVTGSFKEDPRCLKSLSLSFPSWGHGGKARGVVSVGEERFELRVAPLL